MIDKEKLYTNASEVISCMTESSQSVEKQKLPLKSKLKMRFRNIKGNYWKVRKTIGSHIIGNPPYGKGILIQIPLNHMTEEQKKAYWESDKYLGKAGIGCDSGMGCGGVLDLEYDWSLHGCYALCKRCGYDTRDNVREIIRKDRARCEVKKCTDLYCVCRNDKFMGREELGY